MKTLKHLIPLLLILGILFLLTACTDTDSKQDSTTSASVSSTEAATTVHHIATPEDIVTTPLPDSPEDVG